MVKQKKSIVLMARGLALALLIGVFASVPSEQTFAAANKALRSKVVFNGDKESDAAWMNNNYVMQAGYKKASKIKKSVCSGSSLKKEWRYRTCGCVDRSGK